MEGVIKRLKADVGYGFLKCDATGTEYFFHRSGLAPGTRFEHLTEAMRVAFEEDAPGEKGPRARDVRAA